MLSMEITRGISCIAIGIGLLVLYKLLMRLVDFSGKDDVDIKGTVLGIYEEDFFEKMKTYRTRNMIPWYKKLLISYTNPFNKEQCVHLLQKEVNPKKHPVGSPYTLHYSVKKNCVYADGEFQSTKSVYKACFLFMGIMLIICGMTWLIMGIS